MKSLPTGRLRAWTGEVSGGEAVAVLDSTWAEFAQRAKPMVTLFGAFDTGKSSILRRLVVDSVQRVPDWLTVSARHETFDDNVIDITSFSIRDTPGLSPHGQDARSFKNSSVARAVLGLTDVLLVTLNPQLATGEREELLEILADEWPESSVWFLISRADEGGVDPTLDPAGFENWAQRKRAELRSSLNLDENVPIYVVVPDYGQIGAFEPDPEPRIWDVSRKWDGIDQLQAALANLSADDIGSSRSAAETRFWRRAVSERIEKLRAELADLTTSRDTAITALAKRDVFLKSLDALSEAAAVSIEGTIEEAALRALTNPDIDAASIQKTVESVLDGWWEDQQAEISRIRQDATMTFDQQREGRSWATFESLYSTNASSPAEGNPAKQVFTPRFEMLGRKAVDGLKAADAVRKAHNKVKKPLEVASTAEAAHSGLDLGQFAGVGAAALPFVIELAGVIEDVVQTSVEKARRRARRQQLEADVMRIAKDATRKAMKELTADLGSLRQEVSEQTIGQDDASALEAAVADAADLVSRGDALLSRSVESLADHKGT